MNGDALVLPVVLFVAWGLSWLGTRRLRWWLVLGTPVALVAALVFIALNPGDSGCTPGACSGGPVAHWASSEDAALNSGVAANCMAALLLSVPLFLVTLVVETVRLVRRAEAADRR